MVTPHTRSSFPRNQQVITFRTAVRSWPAFLEWFRLNSFVPDRAPAPARLPWSGYAAALILAIGTVLIMHGLVLAFPDFSYLNVLYLPAVILAAFTWGVGPGVCCTIIGAVTLESLVLGRRFARPLWHTNGLVDTVVLILVGIGISVLTSQAESGRRQALALARALRESERDAAERAGELEATFEAMVDGVAVFNHEGRIASLNPAARELVGSNGIDVANLQPHDVRGMSLPEDDWPQHRVLQGQVLTGMRTVDLLIPGPDGMSVRVNVSGAPTRDSSGSIRGAVLVIRDVTARRSLERRAIEALDALLSMAHALVGDDVLGEPEPAGARTVGQRMAELTRSVLGCAHVSIVSVDRTRGILEPVGVVGLSPDEERRWWGSLAGLPVAEYLSEELARRLEAEDVVTDLLPRYEPAQNGAMRAVLVTRLHIGSGALGFLTLGQRSSFDADGIMLVGGVARLITLVLERERLLREAAEAHGAELALREANRRMDEFLGIASHELRTPLTSMRGFVQLTSQRLTRLVDQAELSQPDLPDRLRQAQDLLSRAERQFLRLDRLITDLLDASRARAGRLDMRLERIDLGALIKEMVQEQRLTTPGRVVQLAPIPAGPVLVLGDPDRLGQVVTNFLTNAHRYSPLDCPVEVSVSVEAGRVRVQVRDEGPGIPPAEQSRIWERFYRVPGTQSIGPPTGGLGLGLHISRTIVEKHGGDIGLISKPGQGATFWFTVPLTPP